jgi:hypothetical protein
VDTSRSGLETVRICSVRPGGRSCAISLVLIVRRSAPPNLKAPITAADIALDSYSRFADSALNQLRALRRAAALKLAESIPGGRLP